MESKTGPTRAFAHLHLVNAVTRLKKSCLLVAHLLCSFNQKVKNIKVVLLDDHVSMVHKVYFHVRVISITSHLFDIFNLLINSSNARCSLRRRTNMVGYLLAEPCNVRNGLLPRTPVSCFE